ncbi:MAG: aspartate-semialdehyde dehydrogenase [Bacteroidia bacterium]
MHIAVVGATGLVGRKMLEVLDESGLKIDELLPAASEKSAGMELEFQGKKYVIRTIEDVLSEKPDAALFSAGGSVSLEWAPKFAEAGITVIDNSSAFRMDADKPLCVPEINANQLTKNDKIIANPNCSTIQLVMILNPLHKLYGLKRVVVSTYQSITGTGAKAVEQMEAERAGKDEPKIYKYQIDKNCIPQCDVFAEDGYTKEELKVVNETRKILGIPQLGVTCTAVRVPVVGGHSESVNIEFNREPNIDEIRKVLDSEEGISLQDDPDTFCYPMPLTAHNKNEVFVGRIRKDFSQPNTINLWIVADNLRKGAATNAVQILKYLQEHNLLGK